MLQAVESCAPNQFFTEFLTSRRRGHFYKETKRTMLEVPFEVLPCCRKLSYLFYLQAAPRYSPSIFPIDDDCLIRFTMRNSSKIAQPDVIPHQRSQLPIYHCGHIHFGLVVVCHSYRIAE